MNTNLELFIQNHFSFQWNDKKFYSLNLEKKKTNLLKKKTQKTKNKDKKTDNY